MTGTRQALRCTARIFLPSVIGTASSRLMRTHMFSQGEDDMTGTGLCFLPFFPLDHVSTSKSKIQSFSQYPWAQQYGTLSSNPLSAHRRFFHSVH